MNLQNPNTWTDNSVETIKTPFNIEKILCADVNLYAEWKKHPFWLDIEKGKVVIKYFDHDIRGVKIKTIVWER